MPNFITWFNNRINIPILTGLEVVAVDANGQPRETTINSIRYIPYEDVAYAATISLNISGYYKNITGATGNFTVNATGVLKGLDYIFTVKKTTADPIILTFGTGFTGLAIIALKGAAFSGNSVTLSGAANLIFTIRLHFQTESVIAEVDKNASFNTGL